MASCTSENLFCVCCERGSLDWLYPNKYVQVTSYVRKEIHCLACHSLYGDGNTEAFVARVNTVGLCGFSDWRLPVSDELSQIVANDRGSPAIAIDTAYFPNTQSGYYWSASPAANYNNGAWLVHFGYGSDSTNLKYTSGYVRLVRGSQSL